MKKVAAFFLLLLTVTVSPAQKISFAEMRHDFGLVRESEGAVYHDFYFMNTGDRPLYIKSVLSGCGCTTSEWSQEAVLPGEKGCIRVTYLPEGRREKHFLNVAEVYTNSVNYGTHSGVHNLSVLGEVSRDVAAPAPDYRIAPVKAGQQVKQDTSDRFDLILSRMRQDLFAAADVRWLDSAVIREVNMLRRGGRWADVDYACYFRTNWQPVEHLNRVCLLAQAYVNPESRFCGNDSLFVAIRDALAFWKDKSPKSHNWWFNQIAVPQRLGEILVLMDAGHVRLDENLRNKLFRMMEWPDPRKWTGANKLDIALHHLQRGALLHNDSIVNVATQQAFYPIRITLSEGIQPDMSYHQHDNQLYIGSYGTVFAEGVTRVAFWLRGTEYALRGEQLALFSDFIRSTYLNVFRGSSLDFSVVGRGISRRNQLDGHGTVVMLDKLVKVDPEYAGPYRNVKKRFQPGESGRGREDRNRVYWRSDYTLHNRPAFDFSVRTASVRTRKTESGNGENLKGGFLSDGATVIRVDGDEYNGIFPVWDWNLVPGVTAPAVSSEPATAWGEMGKSVFSGGVSDGKYGVMAFHLNDYGMEARKAWFFLDEEVVCLGAGITVPASGNVATCVNQCMADGNVVTDKGVFRSAGDSVMTGVSRVIHDKVLYVFPGKTEFCLSSRILQGNWNDINYNEPDRVVGKKVFKLWINHNDTPEGKEYAYIVVPGKKDISDYDARRLKIVANDTLMQAVYLRGMNLLQVVFYGAAEYSDGEIRLVAGAPCVVMVTDAESETPRIWVADPTQKLKSVDLGFSNGKCKRIATVELPQKQGLTGSSVEIN